MRRREGPIDWIRYNEGANAADGNLEVNLATLLRREARGSIHHPRDCVNLPVYSSPHARAKWVVFDPGFTFTSLVRNTCLPISTIVVRLMLAVWYCSLTHCIVFHGHSPSSVARWRCSTDRTIDSNTSYSAFYFNIFVWRDYWTCWNNYGLVSRWTNSRVISHDCCVTQSIVSVLAEYEVQQGILFLER